MSEYSCLRSGLYLICAYASVSTITVNKIKHKGWERAKEGWKDGEVIACNWALCIFEEKSCNSYDEMTLRIAAHCIHIFHVERKMFELLVATPVNWNTENIFIVRCREYRQCKRSQNMMFSSNYNIGNNNPIIVGSIWHCSERVWDHCYLARLKRVRFLKEKYF